MADHRTEDEKAFGPEAYVYCSQHMRPHTTGWCTVSNRNKTKLAARNFEDALKECEKRGFAVYK